MTQQSSTALNNRLPCHHDRRQWPRNRQEWLRFTRSRHLNGTGGWKGAEEQDVSQSLYASRYPRRSSWTAYRNCSPIFYDTVGSDKRACFFCWRFSAFLGELSSITVLHYVACLIGSCTKSRINHFPVEACTRYPTEASLIITCLAIVYLLGLYLDSYVSDTYLNTW
jgi:hypothetical protein